MGAEVKIQCPSDIVRVADSRSTKAWVSWEKIHFNIYSTNPIKGIYQTVPHYGASVNVRRQFDEGRHYVEYKAVDETGNFHSCSFNVIVKVVRCTDLYSPQFGSLSCEAGSLQGSQCSVDCVPGYSIVGESRITCHSSGQWSHDTPFCRTTTCPDPGTPIHGYRNCSTATHAYGSTCRFSCNRGYHLEGARLLVCHANGDATYWSGPVPTCQRIEPPRVDICPTDIQETTGRALTPIERPEVRFLTSKDRLAPYTCTHFGADSGVHNFSIGTHRVTCIAWDPAFGEEASAKCEFSVRIKANPCRSLSKPLHGFLMCSSALGGGSPSHETTCTLICHQGFVPARTDYPHDNAFTCDHTGTWNPSHHVPSCVRPQRPRELKLPSEVFYRSSNCSDPAMLNDIRTKFQTELRTAIRQEEGCERSPGDCIVEDVQTTCRHGVSFSARRDTRMFLSRRRKRLQQQQQRIEPTKDPISHLRFQLPILFDLGTRLPQSGGQWPDEYHKALKRLFGMFDYFEELLHEGRFSLGDRWTSFELEEVRDSLTHADKKAICDMGYQFNHSILLCVPCGAGTHFSISQKRCVQCAPGSFQDSAAQFSCKQCPQGTATPEEGSTNVSQCVDLNECETNPCLHNGQCINTHASFSCVCAVGYSGERCEDQVYDCSQHSCLNGGSCEPLGRHNHTCICRTGYSGFYCQFHTVDGGWSEWSEWSTCSKSCEGGEATRTRICDSPPPTYGGNHCEGAETETKVCNLHRCPECQRLRRPYQGSIKCIEHDDHDVVSCTVQCRSGFAFSGPVEPVYVCGRNTSYLWPHESPDNPRCIIPACTKVTEADEIDYKFSATWPISCDADSEEQLRSQIHKRATQVTSTLSCMQKGSCRLNEPEVDGCESTRRKRSLANDTMTPDGVEVAVRVTYFLRSTEDAVTSPPIDQHHDAVGEIESLGRSLLSQSRTKTLFLKVSGKKVYASRTKAVNDPVCPSGKTPAPEGQFCDDFAQKITIGVLVAVVLLALASWSAVVWWRRRRKRYDVKKRTEEMDLYAEAGPPGDPSESTTLRA
ncbi:hypothetical protein CAPTEDRAFT_213669 [Capitella teleta]|uniref:Sushi, von Willebrand factor type A, EGF and pentraxin domain-containing protein 1 n=1 Tax=Capitella teleta TaxID=283909 RepID=R7VCP6_CAPTE|nr:hypothetical protein CAPTEDRAFT_213669 [Capitella teleta]|eukprot:ELU13455.1 hypothetical protein CAPTEDRAFT_213669 [Capitella teleta]